ncbi:MAG: hypothetical protein ACXVPU_13180 [Bacteroidia bacterium]
MDKKVVFGTFIIMFFFFENKIFSQNSTEEDYRELTAVINYNKPLGKLNFVYKPALGLQLGYNWVHDDYSENTIFKKGINFGITQFKPKADTMYYLVSPDSYGTAVYSKYLIVTATFHIEYIKTFNKLGLMAGADAGFSMTNYSCQNNDKNINLNEEFTQGKLVLSPQLGLNYEFSENISASFGFQYTGLISFGGNDIGHYDYNPVIGIYKQYGSIYLKAGYSF